MQHHRNLPLKVIFSHVFSSQSFRHREIQLQRRALPHPPILSLSEKNSIFGPEQGTSLVLQLPAELFMLQS